MTSTLARALPSTPASPGNVSLVEVLQRLDTHRVPTPEVSLSRLLARIERRRRLGSASLS
jgi:hypothetical protein